MDSLDGVTSLREAIAYANSHEGDDAITFDASLADTTITLLQGQLELTDTTGTTTITGFLESVLTISGNDASRVFHIADGTTVVLSCVIVSNGYIASDDPADLSEYSGAGVWNAGDLTISMCDVSDSEALYQGGGVYNSGTLTVTSSSIGNNSAQDSGGGIYSTGTLSIAGSSISGNNRHGGRRRHLWRGCHDAVGYEHREQHIQRQQRRGVWQRHVHRVL